MVNTKVRKITTIAVDKQFFNNVFDKQRKKLQEQLGVMNLSQANFSKMIQGFKLKIPDKDLFQNKPKRGGKKNEMFLF